MRNALATIGLLCSCSLSGYAQQTFDTFRVYFDLNADAINDRYKLFLDSLNYVNILVPGKPISIIGYTDFLASDEYNQDLSERRANNVRKHLNSFGVRDEDLRIVLGKGERNSIQTATNTARDRGVPGDRRVEIVLERANKNIAGRIKTRNGGIDTTIRMKPWRSSEPPPSTGDPEFDINKIPVGSTFILRNIHFPMGRHFPKQESFQELDNLLQLLKEYSKIKIRIEGHICCVDNMPDALDLDSKQLDLSVNRARFVYEYLAARGIAKNRLSYYGFGKSRPIIANEQTEQEASINRRVEIRILAR